MDRYILLLRLVGKFGDKSTLVSRLNLVTQSLEQTLSGRLVSLHATLGEYDFVAIVDVPKDQELKILDCLRGLRAPGDVQVTMLRAFDYTQVYR